MNCKDCFNKLSETFKKSKNNQKVFFITPLNKHEKIKAIFIRYQLIKKFPFVDNVFFETGTQNDLFEYNYSSNGLFSMYNVKLTPSVLRFTNRKPKYFSYLSIFNNRVYNDSWYNCK